MIIIFFAFFSLFRKKFTKFLAFSREIKNAKNCQVYLQIRLVWGQLSRKQTVSGLPCAWYQWKSFQNKNWSQKLQMNQKYLNSSFTWNELIVFSSPDTFCNLLSWTFSISWICLLALRFISRSCFNFLYSRICASICRTCCLRDSNSFLSGLSESLLQNKYDHSDNSLKQGFWESLELFLMC